MTYFHATWRHQLPSIIKHGLGGAKPGRQNFPVEEGVYLALDPVVATSILIEAYMASGEHMNMSPPEALAAMCVIVIDDWRVDQRLLDVDPNLERQDLTRLYRGVIDITNLAIVSVDDLMAPNERDGPMAE